MITSSVFLLIGVGSLLPIAVETPIKVKTPLALPGLLYLYSVDVGEPHKRLIQLTEQEQYNMKTFHEQNLLPYIRESLKTINLEKYEKDIVIPILRSNHIPSIMTQYDAWKHQQAKQTQKQQPNENIIQNVNPVEQK